MNDHLSRLSEEEEEWLRQKMVEAGWDKLNKEDLLEAVSSTLDSLVQQGFVERLIGEDGEFYYRSTGKDERD